MQHMKNENEIEHDGLWFVETVLLLTHIEIRNIQTSKMYQKEQNGFFCKYVAIVET